MRSPCVPRSILGWAHLYAEHGFAVFPCRDKVPTVPGGEHGGCKAATTSHDEIDRLWSEHPGPNIGVTAGLSCPRLVQLDTDRKDDTDGGATLAALEARHGALPITPMVQTRTGQHRYFIAPAFKVKNSVSSIGPGVDVRAGNGYCIVPPSRHPSGFIYSWLPGLRFDEVPLAPLPKWLAEMLRPAPEPVRSYEPPSIPVEPGRAAAYGRTAVHNECKRVLQAPVRTRNNTLNIAALKLGSLVAGGVVDERLAVGALVQAAIRAGLPEHEAVKTTYSGLNAGMKSPRGIPERA